MENKEKIFDMISGIYSMLFYGVLLVLVFVYIIVEYSIFIKILIILPIIFLILLGMKVLKGVKWAKIVSLISYVLIGGYFIYSRVAIEDIFSFKFIFLLGISLSILGIIFTSISFFKKKDESLDVAI